MKPAHIAIIMDGNGRWAQARGLPRAALRLEWQWYRYQSRNDTGRMAYARAALALLQP